MAAEDLGLMRTELGLGWSAELGLRLPTVVRALARPGASPLLLKRRLVLLAILKKKGANAKTQVQHDLYISL